MGPRTLETPRRTPDLPIGGGVPGGGGGDAAPPQPGAAPASIAVWLLVGAVTILFAAFTSTYLARRGGGDWSVGPVPDALYASTALLIVSSLVLEWSRRRGSAGDLEALRTGLLIASGLGVGFLAAQIVAWRQLAAVGVFLSTHPHSSFFYLLTSAHALHVLGGLLALSYAAVQARRADSAAGALRTADPATTFWHFLAGLWVYLVVILFVL